MSKVCKWTQAEEGFYDTSCGRSFTPQENEYNFCPGCGGKLEEVKLHPCHWCKSWCSGECLEDLDTCDKQKLNGEG
jgi:predicted RNA-binding Zn-ribbon protein involved in translation (DUF1610 family)